jgi:hypothetical protein
VDAGAKVADEPAEELVELASSMASLCPPSGSSFRSSMRPKALPGIGRMTYPPAWKLPISRVPAP